MMNKELDFIEWARNSGHGKTQVPMNLLEMMLDYQKYVETKFKNLDIQRVSQRSELLAALKRIEELCDNQNETHASIWRVAYNAVKAANCG